MQLIFYHTVVQTIKTLSSGLPRPIYDTLPTEYPYRTRNCTQGLIRNEESKGKTTFQNRAMHFYNMVPLEIRQGSIGTVKKKLNQWVQANVPIDWG